MEYLESAPKSHVQTEPPCFPVLKVFCAWVANLLRGLSKVFLASTGISFKQILGALPINQQLKQAKDACTGLLRSPLAGR